MTAVLVDVPWLASSLDDVVVLDASIARSPAGAFSSGASAFADAHIPGARFADLFSAFSDPSSSLPFTVPSVAQMRAAAVAVGVRDGVRVVVYDRNGGAWAARVWWLLRVHGFTSVSVLDGGFGAWTAAGQPVASGPASAVSSGPLTLHAAGDVTADAASVERISSGSSEGLLVCGIRRAQFEDGHIPGSVSLPYPDLLRADGTLDLDRVRSLAASTGLSRTADAVVYCGGGINAAGILLALAAAGLPSARLYDGSLNAWKASGRALASGG